MIISSSKRKVPTKFQHLVLYTSDLEKSSKWYQKLFQLQFSAKNHPDSSAAMRLINQTMYFYSFGYYHHDFALVARPDVTPDNTSMLYFSMRLKETEKLEDFKRRLTKEGIPFKEGRILATSKRNGDTQVIHFLDSVNQYWIEVIEGPTKPPTHFQEPKEDVSPQLNQKSILMPKHASPEKMAKVAPIIKRKWVRELVLLPATISGKRSYNKTEDYGVFKDSKCLVSNMEQMTFFVTSIEKTKAWLTAMGFMHCRTNQEESHPFIEGHTLKCAYFSLKHHNECVVIMEHRNRAQQLIAPTIQDAFHAAFELEGNRLEDTFTFWEQNKQLKIQHYYGPVKHNNSKPHGDGESGGNVAVYYYTPDYHHMEFCADMDCVDNYEGRYGTGVRTLENDVYYQA